MLEVTDFRDFKFWIRLYKGLRPHAAGPLGLEIRLRSGEVASCIGELRLPSGEVALCIGDRGLPETSGGAPRRLRRFKNRSLEAPGRSKIAPRRPPVGPRGRQEAPDPTWPKMLQNATFLASQETTEGGTKPQNLGILETSPW